MHMKQSIYFTDKELLFSEEVSSDAAPCWEEAVEGPITKAKVLNFFETDNTLTVLTSDLVHSIATFSRGFCCVTACGGVVQSDAGELLLIRRNGRWDLPKGRWEAGETLEACALRETEEETGVRAVELVRHLGATLHAYNTYGPWELKRTEWYLLRVDERQMVTPQQEEGIEEVRWCSLEEARKLLRTSYPTIREVFNLL